MIVEFLDKLAVPGIETRIDFDQRTLRGKMIIHAHHKNKQAQFELHPDMDDDTFVCGVSKALAALDAAPVPAAEKTRYESPRAEVFGPTPWIVSVSNRIQELSRAVNAKIALVSESAMTDAERLEAFRQLAVWARELDLTVKLVLEMLKEGTKNENS